MSSFNKGVVIVFPQGTWGCGVVLTSQGPQRQKIIQLILHMYLQIQGEPFVTEKDHLPLNSRRCSLGCLGGENCIVNMSFDENCPAYLLLHLLGFTLFFFF